MLNKIGGGLRITAGIIKELYHLYKYYRFERLR